MKKAILIFALVSLLFVGMLPVVEAPNNETWDVIYNVDAVYPESASPAWTRLYGGSPTRSIVYNDQILKVVLGSAETDQYSRFISDDDVTEFFVMEARLNITWDSTHSLSYVRLQCEQYDPGSIFAMEILPPTRIMLYEPDSTTLYYVDNYTDENHTFKIVVYHGGSTDTRIDAYIDGNYIGTETHGAELEIDWVLYRMSAYVSEAMTIYTDDILYRYTNVEAYLLSELAERDAKIDELERELSTLRKKLADDMPGVTTNQTTLPTIPTREGGIDDETLFVDPYRTIVYSVKVSDSGDDLDFYLPRPTTSDEYTIISDEIWIAEKSYDDIWINDTAGATVLLTTSDPVIYYNIQWGYNLSVEVSGTSASVRADRVTVVRLIDSFNWGWNRDSGIFVHQSTIENEIAYNMEVVRCYWAFPTEDADGADVTIDVASIEVWDEDNNLLLDKGRHYEATEAGGVSLEYRWVNTTGTSASRTVRIQFTRARDVESESYYTIYDGQIAYSDAYGDAPYVAVVHHTQHGTASFSGRIIIRFDLTGQYAGNHLDVRSLKIKRSDSSLFQEFTYDSISNELRITDQSVEAGESITYTLYFDWYDEKSAVYELILGDPWVLYSLLILAGVGGLFIFLDATKEEKKKKIGGILIIGIDVAILIIILVVG